MFSSKTLWSVGAMILFYIGLLSVFLITLPWRLLVLCWARLQYPALQNFVTGFDHFYCHFHGDYYAPHTLLAVFTVQSGNLDVGKFKAKLATDVFEKRDSRGKLVFPKFRQGFQWLLGYRFWVDVKDFDLDQHVKIMGGNGEDGGVWDEKRLKQSLPELLDQKWRKEWSPWDVTFVNGYEGKEQSLIICRWHHSLGDGLVWTSVLKDWDATKSAKDLSPAYAELFKTEDSPPSPGNERKQLSLPEKFKKTCNLVKKLVGTSLKTLEDTSNYARGKIAKRRSRKIATRFWNTDACLSFPRNQVHFTAPFPVDTIKEIRKKYKVGFSAVLTSVVGGSIRKVMSEAEAGIIPKSIPVCCALPKPNHPGRMRNHFFCGSYDLPLYNEPVTRLLRTNQVLNSLKTFYAPMGIDLGFTICGLMPGRLRDFFCRQFISPGILLSTFPVLGKNITFEGHLVSDMVVFHGAAFGDLGLSILAAGCEDQVRFALVIEDSVGVAPKSVQRLGDYIEQEIEELLNNNNNNIFEWHSHI